MDEVHCKNGADTALHEPRVLLIEDDPTVQQIIEEIVNTLGLVTVHAVSAAEAIDSFSRYYNDTVCIILDYGIPGMDISQLIFRFKELKSDVPVILSSGYPKSYFEAELAPNQISGFIPKPFDSQTLIRELQKYIVKQG